MKAMRGIIAPFFALLTTGTFAQNIDKCHTDVAHQEAMELDPNYAQGVLDYEATFEQARALYANWMANPQAESQNQYTIPVVVHVFHNDGPENISKAQILDAIRVLNEDFNRQNADTTNTRAIFQGVAADCGIHFELAKLDENGNCTDGIVRVRTPQTLNARNNVKLLSSWDNDRYLNIYVVKTIQNTSNSGGTILGYAYYPNTFQTAEFDGILIRHDCMGTIGTATTGLGEMGRTLSHEAGHYLGLPHTFNDGCTGGDDIDDTPPASGPNYGCPLNTNSCSNDSPDQLDQIENYMDYSDGDCQNMLTLGQKAVMHSNLDAYFLRGQLTSATNLQSTGLTLPNAPVCIPIADFTGAGTLCVGDSVYYEDKSWRGDVASWSWSFPGGQPSSSTDSTVWVIYDTTGVYSATLQVTNAAGSASTTRTNLVGVNALVGRSAIGYYESFSDSVQVAQDLRIVASGATTWERYAGAGYDDGHAMIIRNFNKPSGEKEILYTPNFDFTGDQFTEFTFKYAFAFKDIDENTDELRVFASTNCGDTWIPRLAILGNQLETAVNSSFSNFIPSSENEWKTASISLAPFQNRDNVQFRFEFTSGGGNNLAIDNLQLSSPLSASEFELEVRVYPNPSNNGQFLLEGVPENARMQLYNMLGEEVAHQVSGDRLILTNPAKGTYVLRITASQGIYHQRLLVH